MRVMSRFPDPRYARGDVVAMGDDLRVETLRDAYRHGIFPWPHEELPLPWFSPRWRTVIVFEDLHVGRSLRKAERHNGFTFTIDRAFEQVIAACADTPRGDDTGTWIGPEIIAAYTAFTAPATRTAWRCGAAQKLVGGLYGIDAGGVFTGESMFHRAGRRLETRPAVSGRVSPRPWRNVDRLSGDDAAHGRARRT